MNELEKNRNKTEINLFPFKHKLINDVQKLWIEVLQNNFLLLECFLSERLSHNELPLSQPIIIHAEESLGSLQSVSPISYLSVDNHL